MLKIIKSTGQKCDKNCDKQLVLLFSAMVLNLIRVTELHQL